MKIGTSNAFKAASILSEHVYTFINFRKHICLHFNIPEIGMHLKIDCNLDAVKYGNYSI